MRWWWVSFSLVMVACGGSDRAPAAGAGGAVDAGADGSSGGAGGFGDIPMEPALGAPCASDADCSPRTVCLTADSTDIEGGGPPHGMCVVDCTQGGGDLCQSIDFASLCVTVGGFDTPLDATDDTAFCVPRCQVGDDSDLASKCGGRLDLACFPAGQAPVGYCFPACRNDADCEGRRCDLGSGLCSEEPGGPSPIGAECTSHDDCDGLCLGFTPTFRMCTGVCSVGSGGCGEGAFDGTPLGAACLFGEVPDFSTLGDSGFCGQLCDCNDDCRHPGAVCEPLSIQAQTGRGGVCFPAEIGDGTFAPGVPCGRPDAGGLGDAAAPDGASTSDGGDDASAASDASAVDATSPLPEASTDAAAD